MMLHQNKAYLDLLEKTLLHGFWIEHSLDSGGNVEKNIISDAERETGQAWPEQAFTMIGRLRLRNVRDLCERVVSDGVRGGFCECGVWRGGACIYARACLPFNRPVYACDSFSGFPDDEPEPGWKDMNLLRVSQHQVEDNFGKFGLLTNVTFVAGYFSQSLSAVDGPIAVLRLDGDSYRNISDCLKALWSKVSVGGYLICDDYFECDSSKKAFVDFFGKVPRMTAVDQWGAWTQKL